MPDPNSNNTQQDPVQSPPTITTPFVDIPAIPDNIASSSQTTPLVSDSGSSAPSVSFPELKVDEPKKKFGGGKGKIIATILGIVMLVGGVGTGVYLSLNNQNPQEKAASCPGECRKGPSCGAGYSAAGDCGGCPIGAGGVPQVCCAPNSCGGTTSGSGCSSNTTSTSCSNACSPVKGTPPTSFACKWLSASSSCVESVNECGGSGGTGSTTTTIVNVSQSSCTSANGYAWCGKTPDGTCGGFCINPIDKTCDQMLVQECNFYPVRGANYQSGAYSSINSCPTGYKSAWCQCGFKTGNGVCFDRGLSTQCDTTDGLCAVYVNDQVTNGGGTSPICGTKFTYYCSGVDYGSIGKSCDTSTGGTTTMPSNFCGTIQVDTACQGFTSTYVPCKSPTPKPPAPTPSPSPKPTPSPSPSPSPTPVPVAQCQNVTAYSTTWTVLTASQLAQKKAGDSINVCVVGSATAGSFDKAKFTINGTAQAETTTKRPNTQDFCQTYTIPAGTYTFNITAQIHHVILGWK